MEKFRWDNFFIILYSVVLVLSPPVRVSGKMFFLSEIVLIPLFLKYLYGLIEGRFRPPSTLHLILLGALILAYFSGLLRGSIGSEITVYARQMEADDRFFWSKDTIRFVRWLGLLFTPMVVSQVFGGIQSRKKQLLRLFLNATFVMVLISSLLGILDHFSFISAENIYSFRHDKNWMYRNYGTFPSPLEAALMYGLFLVYGVTRFLNDRRNYWFLCATVCIFYALVLTQSASGLVGASISFVYLIFKKLPQRVRILAILGVSLITILVSLFLPPLWFQWKLQNFLMRTVLWQNWLKSVPSHPWFLISGLGFTGLTIDNSLLLFVVIGGIPLFASFLFWFWEFWKYCDEEVMPLMIVWFFSWLVLDSWGYWGIGRFCWFLLGLAYTHQSLGVPKRNE